MDGLTMDSQASLVVPSGLCSLIDCDRLKRRCQFGALLVESG